ncbi:MFS transporter [Hamadaea tsunoensis]|uniref:MFS transporter n=1 Tax=Hamadaea tsunoensis TaxID=53368 RepID=UPI000429A6AE|nr:MFS transporter [Hamadaea tsunoensis]
MPPERDSKYLTLAATLFAVAMTFIDQTIVSIAAPTIQDELGLSREGTRWIVNAYLLALAATFALGGRIADVVGPRRMMIVGVIGFAAASALCGLTPTGSAAEPWIIAFRVVQGVSAALMVPAALAIVVSAFPVNERGRALAIFFAISGGLTAIGPIAGGYLTQWTWRAIFWINIPVAVAALVLAWFAHIPDKRRNARIDWTGAAIITVGMALSVLGFEQAQVWGWGSWKTILCIVAGVAFIVLFVLFEVRQRNPLIQMKVFASRAFNVDNLVLFFSMMAFVPVFFFASVYAQVSLGFNANNAGLYLLLIFAGFAPAAQIGGRMLDRGGARRPVILGSAVATIAFGLWANSVTDLSLGAQWPYIVLSGAGLGLIVGPASTDAVNRAIGASYGEVTGITQTIRNYGSALGVAILGTLLSDVFIDRLTSSLEGLGVPAGQAQSAANTAVNGSGGSVSDAPAAIRDQLNTAVMQDYATATKYVLWGMALALFLTLLVALRHPGGQAVAAAEEEPSPGATRLEPAPEQGG